MKEGSKKKDKFSFLLQAAFILVILLLLYFGLDSHQSKGTISYSIKEDGYDMLLGTENNIIVSVENTTGDAYTTANNVFLSYHIYSESGEEVVEHGYDAYIESLPGTTTDVPVCILAPDTSGYFKVSIDMIDSEGKWMSDQDIPTLDFPVHAVSQEEYVSMSERQRVVKEIDDQKIIEKNIMEELNSGSYSFETPLTIIDPYDNSPLTALILFTSDDETKISIHVDGKDKLSSVDYDFSEYTKNHVIPVYGLYADIENKVKLTSHDRQGKTQSVDLVIKTDPLISDLDKFTLTAYMGNADKYEPGFNFSCSSYINKGYKMAFDSNGDIRWYLSMNRDSYEATDYDDLNRILMCGINSNDMVEEYNLLGKLINAWYIGDTIHHELMFTKEGNIMAAINQTGEDTVEDGVMEIDYETGDILTYLDYRKILQKTRDCMFDYSNEDWLHMNSIVENGDDIIVSNNHQSSVVCNDREGNIKWMLADPIDFLSPWSQYLLTPVGEDFEWPYNQHSLQLLPDQDGNAQTIDIMLFDNGTSRKYLETRKDLEGKYSDGYLPGLYSRMVQYRIDEANMTVEQIWEYGKDRPELYSAWRSDANLLDNGTILGTFCRQHLNLLKGTDFFDTVYVEVDREKNVVWECVGSTKDVTNNYWDYRCERKQIYSMGANDLKIGQEAKLIETQKK